MKPVYLRKESINITRKVMLDMAYLVSHKKIRLPKVLFEDGLYFLFRNNNGIIEKYFISKDKVVKEDEYHLYFKFPFKENQVEGIETETV